MSSPLYKHTNDSSAIKQRKVKSTNAAKSTTNLDTRTELADLVKRKAEIAVSLIECGFFFYINHKNGILNVIIDFFRKH